MVFPLCGMKSFHYLYTQIAGRQQQFQWQVDLRVAIAEQFFVDDCQERVLYGRPGLPYLVEEHHVSRWQITLRVTLGVEMQNLHDQILHHSFLRTFLRTKTIFLRTYGIFLRSNHRSFLRSGFIATSSMNRDVNQEGQAVFGSLKGVKVVGKRTDTVIDVTSSTLQA